MKDYINYFYDDIATKYSEYHNSITSSSLFKSVFKKVDTDDAHRYYKSLLIKLTELVKKVENTDEDITEAFLAELYLFGEILAIEVLIYKNNKNIPVDELKKLSKERLESQQRFSEYDSKVFRMAAISYCKED